MQKDTERCADCSQWQYNEQIEQRYGMGSGRCEFDGEIKGCDRMACSIFHPRLKEWEPEKGVITGV